MQKTTYLRKNKEEVNKRVWKDQKKGIHVVIIISNLFKVKEKNLLILKTFHTLNLILQEELSSLYGQI